MTLHQEIPLNKDRRHFVVGDIHGRYEAFLNLLDEINYDQSTDMIYSVGDLIDRGPQSVETVEFFKQPNTYAVRGNHEQMLVNPREWRDIWLYPPNGGPATLLSLESYGYDEKWLADFCRKLPICLDVGEKDEEGAFRLIHAELPPSVSEDDFRLFLIEHPADAPEGELLWGRTTVMQAQKNVARMKPAGHGIEFHPDWTKRQVFCGHTPTELVVRVGNMWWIDTWKSKTMTMMNALTLEKFVVDVSINKPNVHNHQEVL